MKTIIYYFSGTGNSLSVAKDISKNLDNCTLEPIVRYLKNTSLTVNYERIGFVFPLYYQQVPKVVLDFINKLIFTNVRYVFSITTRGVPIAGAAIRQMSKLLKSKNIKLNLGSYVDMPQNCINGMKVPNIIKREKIFKKAKNKIKKICNKIEFGLNNLDTEPFSFLKNVEKLKAFQENVIIHEDRFVSDEKCNTCNICVSICPVNNILINNKKPDWLGNCINCLACIHFCPKESIQYGNKTINSERYHHPEISLDDIKNQKYIKT